MSTFNTFKKSRRRQIGLLCVGVSLLTPCFTSHALAADDPWVRKDETAGWCTVTKDFGYKHLDFTYSMAVDAHERDGLTSGRYQLKATFYKDGNELGWHKNTTANVVIDGGPPMSLPAITLDTYITINLPDQETMMRFASAKRIEISVPQKKLAWRMDGAAPLVSSMLQGCRQTTLAVLAAESKTRYEVWKANRTPAQEAEEAQLLAEARARRAGGSSRYSDAAVIVGALGAFASGLSRGMAPLPAPPRTYSMRPVPSSRPAPVPGIPASPRPAARQYGDLPVGVGNAAQRNFWASKCRDQLQDGSSAAQGCQQTLQMLRAAPSGGTAASGGAIGGAVTPTSHCITMRPQGGKGLGFWEVVNSCGFAVIGSFWYGNDRSRSSGYNGWTRRNRGRIAAAERRNHLERFLVQAG